jgi:hypothetical protein
MSTLFAIAGVIINGLTTNSIYDYLKPKVISYFTSLPKMDHQDREKIISQLSGLIKDFDSGNAKAAGKMATILKEVLYSYKDEPSLFEKHGLDKTLLFFNAASIYHNPDPFPYSGLVSMKTQLEPPGSASDSTASYIPRTEGFQNSRNSLVTFPEWWNAVILDDRRGHVFTRKTLILNIAKYEENEPIQKYADDDYKTLTKPDFMGMELKGNMLMLPAILTNGTRAKDSGKVNFSTFPPGVSGKEKNLALLQKETPISGKPELISIRVIAEELDFTLANFTE